MDLDTDRRSREVPAARAVAIPPGERYGWLIGAVWLAFLTFPLLAGLRQQQEWWGRALVVIVIVSFAAVFIRGFIRLGYAEGWRERQAVGWRHLAVLLGLLLCAAPLAGWDSLGMMPFIVSFAMFSLPLRQAGLVFATAVALTLGLLLWAGILGGAWPLAVIVTGVGVATGLTRLIEDRQREHQRLSTQMVLVGERERVARDVHDVLGHSLTVISLKADLAARLMDVDPGRARAEVQQIHDLSRQALAEVRTTVGGLRVARLADEVEAARTVLGDAGIVADLPDDVEVVDPRHRIVLAWALREAVTNVVRHSGATRCTVTLGHDLLHVEDDGHGVDGAEGNGIRGLRERVTAAGGTLSLHPGATGGTVLEVQL